MGATSSSRSSEPIRSPTWPCCARSAAPLTQPSSARAGCVEVSQLVDDAPAARAGLRIGDLIIALNHTPVQGMRDH